MELYIFGIIFIILTIGFFVLRNYMASNNLNLLTYLYVFLIMILQYFLNVEVGKMVCGFTDYKYSLLYTFLPWVLIFGSVYISLMFLPDWLNPFANTFGFLFTSFPKNLYSIFDDPIYKDTKTKIMDFLNLNNKEKIASFISSNNIPDSIKIPNSETPLKTDFVLKDIINTKLNVSYFVFYGLTMLLVFFVSLSYMFTSGCKMSVAEMQKRNEDFFKNSMSKKKSNETSSNETSSNETSSNN